MRHVEMPFPYQYDKTHFRMMCQTIPVLTAINSLRYTPSQQITGRNKKREAKPTAAKKEKANAATTLTVLLHTSNGACYERPTS